MNKTDTILLVIKKLGGCSDDYIATYLGWDKCLVSRKRQALVRKGIVKHVFTADGEKWWDIKTAETSYDG